MGTANDLYNAAPI